MLSEWNNTRITFSLGLSPFFKRLPAFYINSPSFILRFFLSLFGSSIHFPFHKYCNLKCNLTFSSLGRKGLIVAYDD